MVLCQSPVKQCASDREREREQNQHIHIHKIIIWNWRKKSKLNNVAMCLMQTFLQARKKMICVWAFGREIRYTNVLWFLFFRQCNPRNSIRGWVSFLCKCTIKIHTLDNVQPGDTAKITYYIKPKISVEIAPNNTNAIKNYNDIVVAFLLLVGFCHASNKIYASICMFCIVAEFIFKGIPYQVPNWKPDILRLAREFFHTLFYSTSTTQYILGIPTNKFFIAQN